MTNREPTDEMTREEAILKLENLCALSVGSWAHKALRMAIDALRREGELRAAAPSIDREAMGKLVFDVWCPQMEREGFPDVPKIMWDSLSPSRKAKYADAATAVIEAYEWSLRTNED